MHTLSARQSSLFLAVLTWLLLVATGAFAGTRQELNGLSVEFPGEPHAIQSEDFAGWEYQPTPDAIYTLTEIKLPLWLHWMHWIVRSAPDAAIEMWADRTPEMLDGIALKNNDQAAEKSYEIEYRQGFPAVAFTVDASTDAVKKTHLSGQMLLVDGHFYLLSAAGKQPSPEQQRFIDSLTLPYVRTPGDADEQYEALCKLSGQILAGALILLILLIVLIVVAVKRFKRRRQN
ncbi:hypothetical protein [Pseudomonas sp. PDM20]|uniref:hypothetical protein n=1 Tax=Pseudomonas sp. PDM20 TaxID=2769254 RepID=UPI00177DC332|nr:hypothetical protein [Pseudomonas sp. PDM20]MBD9685348.1 hypothetical protein [Pseudomonas sp. PDM20]